MATIFSFKVKSNLHNEKTFDFNFTKSNTAS